MQTFSTGFPSPCQVSLELSYLHPVGIFFIFELEAFLYIRMGLSLAKELMSPQKMFSILIFGFPVCTPLIPCRYY